MMTLVGQQVSEVQEDNRQCRLFQLTRCSVEQGGRLRRCPMELKYRYRYLGTAG
jgi:hypothetical protein